MPPCSRVCRAAAAAQQAGNSLDAHAGGFVEAPARRALQAAGLVGDGELAAQLAHGALAARAFGCAKDLGVEMDDVPGVSPCSRQTNRWAFLGQRHWCGSRQPGWRRRAAPPCARPTGGSPCSPPSATATAKTMTRARMLCLCAAQVNRLGGGVQGDGGMQGLAVCSPGMINRVKSLSPRASSSSCRPGRYARGGRQRQLPNSFLLASGFPPQFRRLILRAEAVTEPRGTSRKHSMLRGQPQPPCATGKRQHRPCGDRAASSGTSAPRQVRSQVPQYPQSQSGC